MPIKYLDWIDRPMLRAAPDARFVFGDNTLRVGLGGQAGHMRGEPNAIGVATKWAPAMTENAFFNDTSVSLAGVIAREIMIADLARVQDALDRGLVVYVPSSGLGTGLSQLPQRAPQLYAALLSFFQVNSPDGCPWPK